MASSKHTRRWVAAALVTVLLAAAGYLWLRPAEGFLTGIYPIDDRRAAFLMRFNGDDETRTWVGVVDRDDGVQWDHELPGTTFGIYAGHGLTVSESMVTVQWTDSASASGVMAFSTADGTIRWRSDLPFSAEAQTERLNLTPGILDSRMMGSFCTPKTTSRCVTSWHARRPMARSCGSTRSSRL